MRICSSDQVCGHGEDELLHIFEARPLEQTRLTKSRLRICSRRLLILVCWSSENPRLQPRTLPAFGSRGLTIPSSTRRNVKVQHREGKAFTYHFILSQTQLIRAQDIAQYIKKTVRNPLPLSRTPLNNQIVRREERAYLALYRWTQLRLLCDTRDEALYLLLPRPLRDPAL